MKPGALMKCILKVLFLMRLTIIIILITVFQLSAGTTFGQRLTYKKNTTIKQLFKEIKTQTGYNVIRYEGNLNSETGINANFNNTPIEEVMESALKGRSLTYEIIGKTIIIKPQELSLIDKVLAALASIEVKGKVVNENGQPLEGATIKVKGSIQSTKSNKNGEFILNGVYEKAVLVISFLGYKAQEIGASQNIGTIKLMPSLDELEEVEINAGYYKVKDRERTGSIARVTAETIAKQPISNPLAALIGRMPGVNIEQQSGINGGGFKVEIRGRNSLRNDPSNNGNSPLILIDGVPYPFMPMANTQFSVHGISTLSSPLNNLNPSDIESIEVLKDADATAIYGSRGANGVILVKTKGAKVGKNTFDLNISTGISELGRKIELLNTEQYLEMRNEAFSNDKIIPRAIDYDVNGTWDKNAYTDWQEVLVGGKAHSTNINASIGGGNEFTQFNFRATYSKNGTVIPGDFSEKKGFSALTINHSSANKKFKASFSANYGIVNNSLPQTDLYNYITLPPNAPSTYDGNGNLNWAVNASGASTWVNPLATTHTDFNSKTNNWLSNGILSYEFLPGLILRSSFGYTNVRLNENLFIPLSAQDPNTSWTGSNRNFNNVIETWIIEPQLNYNKTVGNGELDILIGTTFQKNIADTETRVGIGYTSDLLLEDFNVAPVKSIGTSSSQYKYNAVFGRVNYNYLSRYLLNLTGRRDGSSRFGPNKQFANFGAIGAAWIFSNESFIKRILPFLTFGKIRGSYGITGNDQIADYGFLSTYSGTEVYPTGSGLTPTRIANPDYSWETTKKIELAIDLGFIGDRVLLSGSYYRNRSSNQLVGYTLPDIAGFSSIQSNLPAVVQNTGWEFQINTSNIIKKSFSWKSSFNLTLPESKLLSFPNLAGSTYATTYVVGESLFTSSVYHYLGVNPQTGVYDYDDLDGNGRFTVLDRRPSKKNKTTHFYGGLNNSVNYKSFSLDLFFQFASKTSNNILAGFGVAGGTRTNKPVEILDRWQNIGDDKPYQKFSTFSTAGSAGERFNLIRSSDNFSDASFIRLKNVSFSWNVPADLLKKAKLQSLRVFVLGQNLLTITNYLGDPESLLVSVLPPLRTITAGFQLTL